MPAKGDNTDVQDRILHVLTIYPKISPSMLQIALNMPIRVWHPILERLIATGQVSRSSHVCLTPAGRHQSYTVLSSCEVV